MIKLKDILEVIKEDLPTKITDKAIKKSTVIVKSDPDDDSSDDFVAHHKYHSGPHIDGLPAEDDTIDFDDDEDENKGGLQKGKDKQVRGYEPVTDGVIKLKDLIEAKGDGPQKGDYIHDGRINYMEKVRYIDKNNRGDPAAFIQGKEKGATYMYDFAYLKDTGKKKGGKTIWGIG